MRLTDENIELQSQTKICSKLLKLSMVQRSIMFYLETSETDKYLELKSIKKQ